LSEEESNHNGVAEVICITQDYVADSGETTRSMYYTAACMDLLSGKSTVLDGAWSTLMTMSMDI